MKQQLWQSMHTGRNFCFKTIDLADGQPQQINKEVASSGFDVDNPTGYRYKDKPDRSLKRPLTAKIDGYC